MTSDFEGFLYQILSITLFFSYYVICPKEIALKEIDVPISVYPDLYFHSIFHTDIHTIFHSIMFLSSVCLYTDLY